MPSSLEMFRCSGCAGAVLVLLVLGCGDDDDGRPRLLADHPATAIPGCESFSYRPCDILTERCQNELFALMACARKEEPGASSIPPVLLMDEESATATVSEVAAALEPDSDPADFSTEVRGMEMLGLIEAGLIENPSDLVGETIDSVVAFYLIPTKQIVIIDRGEPVDDIEANATLAHELVHSMQDARHGLTDFSSAHSLDSDAQLAATSVIEGEATLYQLLLAVTYDQVDLASIDYPRTFDNLADIGSAMTLEAGSPMITASGIFPYTQGARYVGFRWLQGQEPALDALYAAPPANSLEVMAGQFDAPFSVQRFDSAPEPLAGHTAVSEDVAGAWVMFGLLGALAPRVDSALPLESLASRWRGDRFWTYRADDATAHVSALWITSWDDSDAANLVAEYLSASAPPEVALDIRVVDHTVRVVAAEDAAELPEWVARLAAVVSQ